MFALHMFWVVAPVDNLVECAVREFCDPSGHKMFHIKRNSSNRFLAVCDRCESRPVIRTGHSRVRVWLTNLQPNIQKSFLELFGQPLARSEAANEERDLFQDRQRQGLINLKHSNRVGGGAFAKVALNGVHGRLDGGFEEFRNLRALYVRV